MTVNPDVMLFVHHTIKTNQKKNNPAQMLNVSWEKEQHLWLRFTRNSLVQVLRIKTVAVYVVFPLTLKTKRKRCFYVELMVRFGGLHGSSVCV